VSAPYEPGELMTRTGRRIRPMDLLVQDVVIEDIAGPLAKICRFGGQLPVFYSVAQHCVLVAELIRQIPGLEWYVFPALLHDAAEAYFGDMISPLKRLPGMLAYRNGEDRALRTICQAFGISDPDSYYDDGVVDTADRLAYFIELRDIRRADVMPPGVVPPEDLALRFASSRIDRAWGPEEAEDAFLLAFRQYGRAHAAAMDGR
jgi:hypothetical protein